MYGTIDICQVLIGFQNDEGEKHKHSSDSLSTMMAAIAHEYFEQNLADLDLRNIKVRQDNSLNI